MTRFRLFFALFSKYINFLHISFIFQKNPFKRKFPLKWKRWSRDIMNFPQCSLALNLAPPPPPPPAFVKPGRQHKRQVCSRLSILPACQQVATSLTISSRCNKSVKIRLVVQLVIYCRLVTTCCNNLQQACG